jgi:hypothetical protein
MILWCLWIFLLDLRKTRITCGRRYGKYGERRRVRFGVRLSYFMIPIIVHQAIMHPTLVSYMQMSDKSKLHIFDGDNIGAGRISWGTGSHTLL